MKKFVIAMVVLATGILQADGQMHRQPYVPSDYMGYLIGGSATLQEWLAESQKPGAGICVKEDREGSNIVSRAFAGNDAEEKELVMIALYMMSHPITIRVLNRSVQSEVSCDEEGKLAVKQTIETLYAHEAANEEDAAFLENHVSSLNNKSDTQKDECATCERFLSSWFDAETRSLYTFTTEACTGTFPPEYLMDKVVQGVRQ